MFEPFRSEFVSGILSKAKFIIDVESNMLAQAARVIRTNTGIKIEHNILKYNGRHITEDELMEAALKLYNNRDEKKLEEVLINGA
jgi:2-oxoglutarate ferredoxin oxidoreductase subunit alpha